MVFLKEEVLNSGEGSGFAQAAGLGEIQWMEEAGHASLADLADRHQEPLLDPDHSLLRAPWPLVAKNPKG